MFQIEQKLRKGINNEERNKKYAKKTKNVPLSQNEVHKSPFGSKMLSYVAHHGIELTCLPCMDLLYVFTAIATCGLNRLSMALRDLVWPCMDFVCPFHSLFVVLYGLLWHFTVFYGRISSFLEVIDPNSFGLVQEK